VSESMLRRVLLVDAMTCVASGLLMVMGASGLAPVLSLPEVLLRGAGVALFPIAAFIAGVGLRAVRSTFAVSLVVLGNLAWAAGALWVVDGGLWSPSTAGVVFALAQAACVLVLSALETRGALALRTV